MDARSNTVAKTVLALIFSASGLTARANTTPQNVIDGLKDGSANQILSVIVPQDRKDELFYLMSLKEAGFLSLDDEKKLDAIIDESVIQMADRSTNFC